MMKLSLIHILYKTVDTEEEMAKLGRFLADQDFFAFDTETDGIDPLTAGLVGMSFAVKENEAWYVPVPADKEEATKVVAHFSPALQNRKSQKIGQNIKFDIIVLRKYGVRAVSYTHLDVYKRQIQSIGPRYCPSIETKIVTFADKTQHQLFLEPEGETTQEYYLNGFSSSLPLDIQLRALQAIPAFRDIQIYRPGYAIEYDFFDPTQLHHNLETKQIRNLFFAGQINGTTGYEERCV